jgi:hypothetical protein
MVPRNVRSHRRAWGSGRAWCASEPSTASQACHARTGPACRPASDRTASGGLHRNPPGASIVSEFLHETGVNPRRAHSPPSKSRVPWDFLSLRVSRPHWGAEREIERQFSDQSLPAPAPPALRSPSARGPPIECSPRNLRPASRLHLAARQLNLSLIVARSLPAASLPAAALNPLAVLLPGAAPRLTAAVACARRPCPTAGTAPRRSSAHAVYAATQKSWRAVPSCGGRNGSGGVVEFPFRCPHSG